MTTPSTLDSSVTRRPAGGTHRSGHRIAERRLNRVAHAVLGCLPAHDVRDLRVGGTGGRGGPALRKGAACGEEKGAWDQLDSFYRRGLGYAQEMGHRPQTLYGIADSPVGLAAWIVEKFRAKHGPSAFVRDQISVPLTSRLAFFAVPQELGNYIVASSPPHRSQYHSVG